MKVLDYRWIGMLVHDYAATCDFFENMLGLELEWRNEEKQITMYRLPSGQEFEVYAPSNRTRNPKYCNYNGPVIGLTVDDITLAREELTAKGAEFVDAIEGVEDGSIRWTHFWGPDGQFYCLHQFDE
jgi:predicted enzyme related to lactoylglutathione lyase